MPFGRSKKLSKRKYSSKHSSRSKLLLDNNGGNTQLGGGVAALVAATTPPSLLDVADAVLAPRWTRIDSPASTAATYVFMNYDVKRIITHSLHIKQNGTWVGTVSEHNLSLAHINAFGLPARLHTKQDVESIGLKVLSLLNCSGIDDLPETNSQPDIVRRGESIYHTNCELIVLVNQHNRKVRCKECTAHRNRLRMRLKRSGSMAEAPKPTSINSRVTLSILSPSDLLSRAQTMRSELKKSAEKLKVSRKKVKALLMKKSVSLEEQHDENVIEAAIKEAINSNTQSANNSPFSSELHQLLWQEQKKQASSNKKGMRWHPTIIRWALTVKNFSSSAYDYIRDSGFLTLPCKRTLDRYTAYKQIEFGIDREGIELLASQLGAKKNVTLLHDEIKIKDKLIYQKSSGQLIGFVQLDEISMALSEIVAEDEEGSIATHALCFMARSVDSKVSLPVAHYASSSMTANEIYHTFWGLVASLEMEGVRVRASVSDGASSNRKFFLLHRSDYPEDDVTYRAKNPYAAEGERDIYFVSDVPHLLKTTRNCFENSHGNKNTRNLILHGDAIKWSFLTRLYETTLTNPSFTKLHKLTTEHVRLSPYARMRVNLAAQVMSQSVANSLKLMDNPELTSTIEFIEKVNDAFDMLNGRYKDEGLHSRNSNKDPYTSADDARFKWLEDEFLGWLKIWRDEVLAVPDLTKDDICKAQLSPATIAGWTITCTSFIHLCRDLLREGYRYILSEKLLCQDHVEQHFAHQRQAGGTNKAPTAAQYLNTEKRMAVMRELQLPSKTGNCRGGVITARPLSIDNTKLIASRKNKF